MLPLKHNHFPYPNEYYLRTKATHFKSFNPKTICLSFFLVSWFFILFFWLSDDSSHCGNKTPLPPERVFLPVCQENFSVYMYDLPEKFNVGLLDDCEHLNVHTNMCPHVVNKGLGQPYLGGDAAAVGNWYATNQFMAEMIFHARMENHPCRTLDPTEATLFYVPFYGGLHASSKFRVRNRQARDALAVELSEYIRGKEYWGRGYGRDHFLALGRIAGDFMRDPKNGSRRDYGANSLLNLLPVKNMSVMTVERDPWHGKNQHGIPYPSYFHPTTVSEMLKWQEKVNLINRSNLFSFIGAPRTGSKKAALRDKIIKQCGESTRCELVKCGRGAGKCHEPEEVMRTMMRSEFCLQTPGDSFTRRSTFDAIVAGCIPVFFSRHTAYTQYGWYLPEDPGEYSVYVEVGRNGSARIEDELMKIPAERVARMRRKVVDLIPTISYMHPNATGGGFRDAVDVALSALSNEVRNSLVALSSLSNARVV